MDKYFHKQGRKEGTECGYIVEEETFNNVLGVWG